MVDEAETLTRVPRDDLSSRPRSTAIHRVLIPLRSPRISVLPVASVYFEVSGSLTPAPHPHFRRVGKGIPLGIKFSGRCSVLLGGARLMGVNIVSTDAPGPIPGLRK